VFAIVGWMVSVALVEVGCCFGVVCVCVCCLLVKLVFFNTLEETLEAFISTATTIYIV